MTEPAPTSGLVLGGAAALGAYEVGVLAYLVDELARDVPVAMPTVLAGTSAGALNATALAAFADEPARGVRLLVEAWSGLHLAAFFRPSSLELLAIGLDVTGAPLRLRRALAVRAGRGGFLDPAPVEELVARIPLDRIAAHLTAGRLRGVAVSATRVSTGAAVIFHQTAEPTRPWLHDASLLPVATPLTAAHVLASAAIPLLFPTVAIDGDRYCDGGLRQMVPLSPAVHLGATRLLVVNPVPAAPATRPAGPSPVGSPLYLAGKAFNALFADRVDADLARLTRTTELLRAGARRFGPTFEREINLELTAAGCGELHAIDAVCIEPSQDLGALAASHVASRAFAARAPGIAGILMRCIADGDPGRVGDLLAYLLFDGEFTAALIDLGRADARARHDELCGLFA